MGTSSFGNQPERSPLFGMVQYPAFSFGHHPTTQTMYDTRSTTNTFGGIATSGTFGTGTVGQPPMMAASGFSFNPAVTL